MSVEATDLDLGRPRVAAIIITRDRIADLKRCVDAVAAQTFPIAATVVVDNASSDGTRDWLDEQENVTAIHQGDEGAAGAMYTGIGYAFEQGFDAMWLLDDDALPEPNALERLVAAPANDGSNVVGSVVVSVADPEVLSFPVPKVSTYSSFFDYHRELTDRVADLRDGSDELGYAWAMFTNSILLPRDVVANIGLPKREFYMGGEEVEYLYRVRSHGYGTYLVLDSICRHPRRDSRGIPRWRELSTARNMVYVHRRYRRWFLLRTMRRFLVYAVTGRWALLRALWDGVRGDFSRRYVDDSRSSGH
jgi:rhamnopyranosyl-N-acetylglucosaminyl-diphospho-decaprenol beta-1,3/1,4-galactofuranosyltransferase